MTLLKFEDVSKSFSDLKQKSKVTPTVILKNASFEIQKHETVAIIGSSGSGKSTFLHIAGLLEEPDEGKITILNRECNNLNDAEKSQIRKNHLGFIYQFHYLLPDCNVLENVIMPSIIANNQKWHHVKEENVEKSEIYLNAISLLDKLGLSHKTYSPISHLSGGERQRVAVARSIINKPRIILADEPTGNLDEDNSCTVIRLLFELLNNNQTSLILVTHDNKIASKCDRKMKIANGQIINV